MKPGFTKTSTGKLEAPTLKSVAGMKLDVYLALRVIMGWEMDPTNFPANKLQSPDEPPIPR